MSKKPKLYQQIVDNNQRIAEENRRRLKEAYEKMNKKDGDEDAKA